MNCFSTSSLEVVVNVSPTKFFNSENGFWQKDPYYVTLNLVVNDLSCMLNQAMIEGIMVEGIQIRDDLNLNHL